ncbi:MAG: PilZ domain-containing protein [Deltaproteobacteria bacterium]
MQKLKRARVSIPSHATRKQGSRKNVRKNPVSAYAKPDRDRRSHERGALKIPVRLRIQGKESSGITHDLSSTGLRVISDTELSLATPIAMQFNFGGDTCYVQVAGQVVFCRKLGNDKHINYEIGIKFSAIREWEQRILNSAARGLEDDTVTRDKSFLTIQVSEDNLAREAANLSAEASEAHPEELYRGFKRGKKLTPHPAWVLEMRQHMEPTWNAILNSRLLQEASAGTLSLPQMRAWLLQLYPFIETFPKWIALNIPKTQEAMSRGYLIDNVRVEKRHAEQWVYMAEGFGLKREDLYTVKPLPEVDALTHWLWSINSQGTLAEAVGATNYAIEGITRDIAKATIKGFPHYEGVDGIHLERKAYWWMEAHIKYDDLHPQQALEIIKLYATTKELQDKVKFVTRRSLEYMLMAFETCYTKFQPLGSATVARGV